MQFSDRQLRTSADHKLSRKRAECPSEAAESSCRRFGNFCLQPTHCTRLRRGAPRLLPIKLSHQRRDCCNVRTIKSNQPEPDHLAPIDQVPGLS